MTIKTIRKPIIWDLESVLYRDVYYIMALSQRVH